MDGSFDEKAGEAIGSLLSGTGSGGDGGGDGLISCGELPGSYTHCLTVGASQGII